MPRPRKLDTKTITLPKRLFENFLMDAHDMLGNMIDAGDDNYRDVRRFRGSLSRLETWIDKHGN